jgi:sigma-B regulation protein RsbU (phosphoserine phosphatase)
MIVSYLRANPELKLLVLTDSTGLIIAHSDDVRSIRKPYNVPQTIDISQTGKRQSYHFEDEQLNYLIMPVNTGEREIGLVHVVYSTDKLRSQLVQEREQIGLMTALLLLFGVLAIYLLSNYFVLPIANITHRVKRFTSGDFDAELPLEGAEEFFEISKAFNQMMTRLGRDRKNIIAREKLAKEIEVASQIQKTLLPSQLPEVPHLQIDAYYRAASMVGGDLYDVFGVAPDRYCLTVADVSGKGVPASMVMSMVRTVIQIFTAEAKTARHALVKVNDYLQHSIPPGMFITVILVIYEPLLKKIRVVSAGHNPMFFYDAAKGELRKVNPGGMPLGVPATIDVSFADTIEEVTLSLKEGDLFFMFTDGLSEATNKDGERYGIERLHQFLARQLSEEIYPDVSQLSSAITAELDSFAGYAEQSDDISFVIGRYSTISGNNLNKENKTNASDQVRVKKLNDPGESR